MAKWKVRVKYEGNPAGPIDGHEVVEGETPPSHLSRFMGAFGWATVQSKRPERLDPEPGQVAAPVSDRDAFKAGYQRGQREKVYLSPREVQKAHPGYSESNIGAFLDGLEDGIKGHTGRLAQLAEPVEQTAMF